MQLFREDGCLTGEGLRALAEGRLDELGRLEVAEHLAYCDRCLDRYTALLEGGALETPPRDLGRAVSRALLSRLMQNVYGRVAVASVAALLALGIWRSGSLGLILSRASAFEVGPPALAAPREPEAVPASGYTEPPRPGGRDPGVTQKAYEAVAGLWDSLTGR